MPVAAHFFPVQGFDRVLGVLVVVEEDEAEARGPLGNPNVQHLNIFIKVVFFISLIFQDAPIENFANLRN